MLTEITLDLTFNSKNNSNVKDTSPAGSEYISDEIFPENKLPSTVLTISTAYAYFPPSTIRDSSINTFESPNLAPGKIMGGNRFSSINANSARAESIPDRVSFIDSFIISPHHRIVVIKISRRNFKFVWSAHYNA